MRIRGRTLVCWILDWRRSGIALDNLIKLGLIDNLVREVCVADDNALYLSKLISCFITFYGVHFPL